MTDRERLVCLVIDAVGGCDAYWAGLIADHLIANGVVFREERGPDGRLNLNTATWDELAALPGVGS